MSNHGLDGLVARQFAAARSFFELPVERKLEIMVDKYHRCSGRHGCAGGLSPGYAAENASLCARPHCPGCVRICHGDMSEWETGNKTAGNLSDCHDPLPSDENGQEHTGRLSSRRVDLR